MKGKLGCVKLLVEEGGANLELKNFYSNTALGVAAENGHLDVVEYLVKKGANVHGNDKQNRSPLIRACING
jgi:ankyrin repeat protein